MSMHRTFIRHFLIINRVKQPGFPSLEDLKEMLEEHDFRISMRTLQRDIENIRNDFGIEIRYDSYHRGYHLDEAASLEMDSILKFLEFSALTGTFNDLYRDTRVVKEFISFDAEGVVKGVEYFSRILFALRNHRMLRISYQKFRDDAPREVEVKPGLLREYQNRWYLMALIKGTGDFRAYALDRMRGLKVLESTYPKEEVTEIIERFNHVIGISLSDSKPEFVELTVDADQWKYIETLPWHPSQEMITSDNETVTFRLYVVMNYELQKKILAEGNHIHEIKPERLAKIIEKRK